MAPLIDRYILLDKLHAIGLSENAIMWFNSYLHNRKQCVVLNGNKSVFFWLNKEVCPKVQ